MKAKPKSEPKVIRSADGASYGIFHPHTAPEHFVVGQATLEREPTLAPQPPALAKVKQVDPYTS